MDRNGQKTKPLLGGKGNNWTKGASMDISISICSKIVFPTPFQTLWSQPNGQTNVYIQDQAFIQSQIRGGIQQQHTSTRPRKLPINQTRFTSTSTTSTNREGRIT